MVGPLIAGAARLAVAAFPKIIQGGKAIGGAVLTGGKIPGGMFGQKALEYTLVVPALGAAAGALGLPFGAPKQQPAVAVGPNAGLTPEQFSRLYGTQGIGIGPWIVPGTAQEGFLQQQAREQRQLQRYGIDTNRDISLGQQGTQRYGFDTQRDIAQTNAETQRAINQTQRELGFANLRTQYGISDLTSRRQLQGLYGGYSRDVALADRRLALGYDTNRTQSRIASLYTNLGRYQADRTTENVRISQIAPQIAAIGSIYNRRY